MDKDTKEIEQVINQLLWKDWNGFFLALHKIAEEEASRNFFSTELLSFWAGIKLATAALPGLPTDY